MTGIFSIRYVTNFGGNWVTLHYGGDVLRSCPTSRSARDAVHSRNAVQRDDEPSTELPRRLISISDTTFLTSLPPATIEGLWRAGSFPRPVFIQGVKRRHTAFVRSEVAAWIAARIHERDAALDDDEINAPPAAAAAAPD
jgi:predicted DNA-binding transcriptional regulator AlpA